MHATEFLKITFLLTDAMQAGPLQHTIQQELCHANRKISRTL